MAEAVQLVGRIAGVKAPKLIAPFPLLYANAAVQEVMARFTGKPILSSLASVRLMQQEEDRSHYDHAKSVRELGVMFRPPEETARDTIAWYRANGFITNGAGANLVAESGRPVRAA